MANNTINVKFKLNEDGSIKKTAAETKKLAKETKNLAGSSETLNKSKNSYNKREKGAAGITSNSTKAFSKQAQTIDGSGGLVPAYATLAANVFALTAAFGVLQRAAALEQLKEGLTTLANTVGRTASVIVSNIQEITDNAVSSSDAFRAAAAGFNAGFSTTEIEGLAKVAKGASIALGRDMTDALDRLVRGTAKLEPEILDELGIFVRLDDAAKMYAETLGKSASQLTQAERRQAFLNQTLTQGQLKFAGIAEGVDVNPYDKLAANVDKLAKTFTNFISAVLGPFISLLANNTTALAGVFLLFVSTIKSQMFPVLDKLGEKYRDTADFVAKQAAEEAKSSKSLAASAKERAKALGGTSSQINDKSKFAKLQKRLNNEEIIGLSSLKAGYESLKTSEASRYGRLKKLSKEAAKDKRKELADIIRQRRALEKLIATEEQAAAAAYAARSAKRTSDVEQNLSGGIEGIQGQGLIEGFKSATKITSDFNKEKRHLVKTTKGLNLSFLGLSATTGKKLAIAFRVGGVGARAFGAALINAIPIIGQIIFVIGLLLEGLISLAQSFSKPSKAQEEFNKVIESSQEKIDQLNKTNEGLQSRYFSVLLDQEKLTKSVKNLTVERVKEIAALAESYAQVEAYSNTLKVTSGLTTEFAGSVDKLGKELLKQKDGGFLSNLVLYVKNGIFDGIKVAIDIVAARLNNLKNILTDNVIVNGLSKVGEVFGEIGVSLFPNLAKSIELAPVLDKMNTFKSTTIQNFKDIEKTSPAVAKAIENDLNMPFEDFVSSQLKGVESAETAADANDILEKAIVSISGTLKQASLQQQKYSDGISKFSENTREAQSAVEAFARSFLEKNKFEVLGEKVSGAVAAVKALKESAEADGSTITFAQALDQQLASGAIKLESFGVSAEEVKEKGVGAFKELTDKIDEAAESLRTGKSRLDDLKEGLKNLSKDFNLQKVARSLISIEGSIRRTGQVSTAGGDLAEIENQYKARKKFIEEEARLKKTIIEEELNLKIIEIELQQILNKGNESVLLKLRQLKSAYQDIADSKRDAVDTDASTQGFDNQINFITGSASAKENAFGSIAGADSTGEALAALSTQFEESGKTFTDFITIGEGEDIFYRYTLGAQALTDALSPMKKELAKLGPDGELAAAVVSGMEAMTMASAKLGESLQKALDTNNFDTFGDAWDAATFEDKAKAAGAAFAAAASSIGAVISLLSAESNASIARIDDAIQKEKERDGTSAASVEKMKQLEAKKEAIARKTFEVNKKLMLAQAVMGTAAGIANSLSLPPPLNMIMAGIIGAMGLAQVAIISGMQFDGGSKSAPSAPTAVSVGNRGSSVDMASSKSASGELSYLRGNQGTGDVNNFTPAFTGAKYRASGGETAGFMVGEQGPELFVPEKPGRIVPADETAAGSTVQANINISALDAAGVEDVLLRQRGNIIGMLREAANSNGETFLESVNTLEA